MVRAIKLLVISAAALGAIAGSAAQAQQGGANSRRVDSSCIRIEQAVSWIMAKVRGDGDWCKARPREESLSSRSRHGKDLNDVRVANSSNEQIK